MTNRFAIIIESSNVRGLDDLPGARLDARNWHSFLTSDLGGAWDENEIRNFRKPSVCEIRSLLLQHSRDYVFLAFSGHGFEEYSFSSGKYVTKICLNDCEQAVAIDAITPPQLGTSVFDCCRGIEGKSEAFLSANESFVANRRTSTVNTKQSSDEFIEQIKRRRRIREIFLDKIGSMQSHTPVRMHSCSRDESAGEDPNAGGYYTKLLLRGAENWKDDYSTKAYYEIYTTKQAHDFARIAMEQINPQQHPEYAPTWQSYPFAVR